MERTRAHVLPAFDGRCGRSDSFFNKTDRANSGGRQDQRCVGVELLYSSRRSPTHSAEHRVSHFIQSNGGLTNKCSPSGLWPSGWRGRVLTKARLWFRPSPDCSDASAAPVNASTVQAVFVEARTPSTTPKLSYCTRLMVIHGFNN